MNVDSDPRLSDLEIKRIEKTKQNIEKLSQNLPTLLYKPFFNSLEFLRILTQTHKSEYINYQPAHDLIEKIVNLISKNGELNDTHYEELEILFKFFIQNGYNSLGLRYGELIFNHLAEFFDQYQQLSRSFDFGGYIISSISNHAAKKKVSLSTMIKDEAIWNLSDLAIRFLELAYKDWKLNNKSLAMQIIEEIINFAKEAGIDSLHEKYKMEKLMLLKSYSNLEKVSSLIVSNLKKAKTDKDYQFCGLLIELLETIKPNMTERNQIELLNEKGHLNRLEGNLDLAKSWYIESKRIAEKIDSKSSISYCNQLLGNIEALQGNQKKAEEYYKESLKILRSELNITEEVESTEVLNVTMSAVLFQLVQLALSLNEVERADRYHRQLLEIPSDKTDPRIRLSEALILKYNKRLRQKMKAEEILDEIIQSLPQYSELTLLAIKHRIELLILEFKLSEEPEVYNEIQELLVKLQDISERREEFGILVQASILSARLSAFQGDYTRATQILTETMRFEKIQKYKHYSKQVEIELENIENHFRDMEQKISTNPELSDAIKQNHVSNYLMYIQNMLNQDL